MSKDIRPETVFALAAAFSAIAGAARQLLLYKRRRKASDVFVGALYASILGLGVSLLWYDYFQDNPYKLIGLCIFAALTGATSIDELLSWLRTALRALEIASNSRGKRDDGKEQDDDS